MASVKTGAITETRTTAVGPFAWDHIEANKYLLADHHGLLSLLHLPSPTDRVIALQPIGRHDATSVIRYLDNRVLYAGSYSGPSSLLRITSKGLEQIAQCPNPGPIIDMDVLPGDTLQASQLIGVGGYDATSALLDIRSGVECQVLSEETKEEMKDEMSEEMKEEYLQVPIYLGFTPSETAMEMEMEMEMEVEGEANMNTNMNMNMNGQVVLSYPTCSQFYQLSPTTYVL